MKILCEYHPSQGANPYSGTIVKLSRLWGGGEVC
jgi:hypothetical protein